MKILKAELEEIIGILIGGVFWYFWAFLIISMSFKTNISYQIHEIMTWAFMGLLVFFLSVGHYLFSRGVIDKKKEIEDLVAIKSNLIGYFIWLILMIFAYLLNIEISSNTSLIAGYIIIFLIFFFMRNRALNRKGISSS